MRARGTKEQLRSNGRIRPHTPFRGEWRLNKKEGEKGKKDEEGARKARKRAAYVRGRFNILSVASVMPRLTKALGGSEASTSRFRR